MNPLLKIENINVQFKVKNSFLSALNLSPASTISAVSNVSFEVKEAEIYGIIGESGCGKTTLAKTVTGLISANSGSITFYGQELVGLSNKNFLPHRKSISMIFQDPIGCLSPRKTIGYSISEPYKIQKLKDKDLKLETTRLLKMVGLDKDFADRYPHQLSGGQARRVGVARALALEPKLIFADEPTAGLDVSIQGELLNLLRQLKDSIGLSIVMITHNLNVARHITDRIGIMYLGEFIEEGASADIFSNPRHPYTLALLSANPIIDFDSPTEKLKLLGEPPSLLNKPNGCLFHQRCPFMEDDCQKKAPIWQQTTEEKQSVRCFHPR